jgi:hypothetical protein
VKSVIIGIMLSFLSLPALASDSLWLLCDNGSLAMNLLEHRSADGQGRVTSLILLYGVKTFSGELTNTNSGRVFLTSTLKDENNFIGDVTVNYAQRVVSLRGVLELAEERRFSINTQLKCKEMRSKL